MLDLPKLPEPEEEVSLPALETATDQQMVKWSIRQMGKSAVGTILP
ncbi:MAG: hypothetical protein NZ805_11725 [Armatimonadetes bacterium]|nr:hypothetical protein [Armatimonadota bacterium]MDW8029992.1 hypothetical protein [Armatimonadota bacterium]